MFEIQTDVKFGETFKTHLCNLNDHKNGYYLRADVLSK